jgi:predicted GIY-YIG superfamily endonuclease
VTSNLPQRIAQHREKLVAGFTAKYGLDRLVWYELHDNAESAIVREKQIKKWDRLWKVELIETANRSGATYTRKSSNMDSRFRGNDGVVVRRSCWKIDDTGFPLSRERRQWET